MCLEATGRTRVELEELARRIAEVFHARGLSIDAQFLQDNGTALGGEGGSPRIAVHPGLEGVFVQRSADGSWLWTSDTLSRISTLYSGQYGAVQEMARQLPRSMHGKVLGVALWQYFALIMLFLMGLVVRKVIAYIVASRVATMAEKLGQTWASRLVDVFASPGATLVMAVIVQAIYPELRLPIRAALIMSITVRVLYVLSLVWAAYRFVDVIAARMAMRAEETDSKLDDQLVPLLRNLLKTMVVLAGGLFILQNLDVDVGSLLAGLGIGGLAFALAAKDTLANFFGSVMIFLDRPFQIGDWIKVAGTEGVVEEVGFRSTRIRTFYNSLVTMPNARFTETQIDNMGQRVYRRVSVTLGLTYDTTPEQMEAFVEGVRAIICSNPSTRKDYYEVHMSGFGDHGLEVMVYFFFLVDTWSEELRQRHLVFLEIMRLAAGLGVSFAFPTRTLHIDYQRAAGERPDVGPTPDGEQLASVVRAFGPGGASARPQGPQLTEGFYASAAPTPPSRGSD